MGCTIPFGNGSSSLWLTMAHSTPPCLLYIILGSCCTVGIKSLQEAPHIPRDGWVHGSDVNHPTSIHLHPYTTTSHTSSILTKLKQPQLGSHCTAENTKLKNATGESFEATHPRDLFNLATCINLTGGVVTTACGCGFVYSATPTTFLSGVSSLFRCSDTATIAPTFCHLLVV